MKSKLSNNDSMGLGSRFSYKITKNDETTPGPGMYSSNSMNTIEMKMTKSARFGNRSNSSLAFGVSKA